ncbi:hypothetical protein [Bradyrhizobium macuxiense]|nr:hypothetical protein [Bradyrhizobium macuxiense]
MIRCLWMAGSPHAVALSAGIANPGVLRPMLPGYYALTLQSLSMVMTGLLLAARPGRIHPHLEWILVGAGGSYRFMTEPPTSSANAVVVMFHAIVCAKSRGCTMFYSPFDE